MDPRFGDNHHDATKSFEVDSTASRSSRNNVALIPPTAHQGSFGDGYAAYDPSGSMLSGSPYPELPTVPPIEQVNRLALAYSTRNRPPRLHEVMPQLGGRIRFRCWGRCVTGPKDVDVKYNVCAWASILVPTGFFFIVCVPHLQRVVPWLPIVTLILFVVTVIAFVLTSCTDPGVIPRHPVRLLVPGLKEEVAAALGLKESEAELDFACFDADLMDKLEPLGYRWCPFCNMVQPPRAKHCRDCDCCILRNDHHCPFVNNCIGQRNYVYFCAFLFSIGCLGASVFCGIGLWIRDVEGFGERGKLLNDPYYLCLTFAVAIPTAILLLLVFGLSIFHTVLICRGRTTREALTGKVFGEGATLFGFRGRSLVRGSCEVCFPGQQNLNVSPRSLQTVEP